MLYIGALMTLMLSAMRIKWCGRPLIRPIRVKRRIVGTSINASSILITQLDPQARCQGSTVVHSY